MLFTQMALLIIVTMFCSLINTVKSDSTTTPYDSREPIGFDDPEFLDVYTNEDPSEKEDLLDGLNVEDEDISKRGALKIAGHKFTAGVKAMRKLLSGAREVAPTDILRREYVKSGGAERAISDFYSVKPKNVRAADDQKILLGEIGDKTILLMRPGAEGATKPPSLLIYKTAERHLPFSFYDKIIYDA